MSVRTGMINLIQELRSLTDSVLNETEVNGVSYWTDEQLQDILDDNSESVLDTPLTARPAYYNGVYEYKRFYIPYRWIEEPITDETLLLTESNTFFIVDSYGVEVSPLSYVYNKRQNYIEFTSGQTVLSFFLRANVIDLYRSASQVWQQKASHRYQLVKYKAGQHQIDEDSEYKHCLERATYYSKRGGFKAVRMARVDYNG